jgi:carbon monoxide dehydrogenase subunit G
MAEQLVNEFTVNRPLAEAWPVICDLERIAPCLPGAQLLEIEGEEYRGVVKVKLGAVATQFKGSAHFVERDDEQYRAKLRGEGRDTGGRGNAAADISATAEALSPTSTKVVVIADLHITGKVAQFGRGILGDVSKKLMTQFADNLNAMLDAEPSPAEAEQSAQAAETAEAAEPTPSAPDQADTAAPSTPAAPTVRKIDGPATEPIDMAGMAGPALAKRAAPAVIAFLVLLLLLRRRRR